MWKDNDFKELFANYNPTPPEKMWSSISYAIQNSKESKKKPPFFSKTQKMTLLAASLSSFLLCGFMMRLIEQSPKVPNNIQKSSSLVSQSLTIPLVIEKRYRLKTTSSQNLSASSNHTVPKFVNRIPEEYKPFEKEILTMALLDEQIAALGEEIRILKENLPNRYVQESPVLARVETQTEVKTNQNAKRYNDKVISDSLLNANTSKLPNLITQKTKFIERFNITPFMGGNLTHVFYQDKPENNYFSDKAQFSGQIGYNAGVQLGYQVSKRWSLESGIGIGQYILGFKEDFGTHIREGNMYIDQLDIPLMARYSIPFGSKDIPLSFSLKGGLMFSNVIFYQVNYKDKFTRVTPVIGKNEDYYRFNVDKRQYNSTQFGYAAGFDFDAFFAKKIALNLSVVNALVSQVSNFPFFSAERQRPVQFSTSFSIGTKIKF